MKIHSLSIAFIMILVTLCACGAEKKEDNAMHITKGLTPAISQYNALEQTLIKKVSEKLSANGYPLNELTRVYLKDRINNKREYYYAEHEIVFLINPAMYKSGGGYISPVESITVVWDDPSVVYTPDGGMEFQVGHKVDEKDLVLTLFRLQESYTFQKPLENQEVIFDKINEIFLACKSEEIKHLTSNGLPELLANHQIIITEDANKTDEYEVTIKRIGYGILDENHFNEVDTFYSFSVNLSTGSLTLLDKFYPGFFPTPASPPPIAK